MRWSRKQRRRSERGMVTAELAVATLAAGALLVALSWGVFIITLQLRCIDSAAAVARQAARGDTAAVAAAKARAPLGATFEVRRTAELVTVDVVLQVQPFRFGAVSSMSWRATKLGTVSLRAEANVVPEPGSS
ncbi:MAG TPA: TadE family type IV pilus minor pilin [Propionibacteriaceae bacterium]|nr:TadE family type IV pilus minor pilin [Propionibacteriaceae bacterium]